MKPPVINLSIDHIELSINSARKEYLIDQWMCCFFGEVLLGMQLWAVNELNSLTSEKCLNAFVKCVEDELVRFKTLIPRIKDEHPKKLAIFVCKECAKMREINE